MGLLQEILGRLQQTGQNIVDNKASGPYQYIEKKIPEPLRGAADASMIPQNALFQLLSLGMDASQQVGKTATGAGLMGLGAIQSALGGPEDDVTNAVNTVIDRNAPNIAQHGGVNLGDLIGLARQTNEQYAQKHSFQTGLANMALDPSNLLTGAAEGLGLIDKAPAYIAKGTTAADLAQATGTALSTSARAALKRQLSAMAGNDVERLTLGSGYRDWMAQLVNKPRNSMIQDNIFNAAMAHANNMPLGDVGAQYTSMADNVAKAAAAGIDAKDVLPTRIGAWLAAQGKTELDLPHLAGAGLIDSGQTQAALRPATSAALQVAYGAANPKRLGLGIAAAPIDAAIGYVRPGMNEFLGQMGHINQTSFRAPAVERGIGEYFTKRGGLEEFSSFAKNLTPTEETDILNAANGRMAALAAGGEDLAVYGDYSKLAFITPDDIMAATKSPILADQWGQVIDQAIQYGGQLAKQYYGDFSKSKGAASMILPFMGWIRQAYPRVFAAAIKEPALIATLMHGMTMSANHLANSGDPNYVLGQIPIGTDSPGTGGIARALLGGREGTLYVDPLGAISPVGGDSLAGMSQDNSKKTPTDQALELMNTLGLPNVNPAIGYALYMSGLSDKVPGNLSGYSGFEQAAPGPEVIPSLTNGIITAARKAAGKYGPSDPYELAAAELVWRTTHKPLDDPANRHYAQDIAQKRGIYQEAKAYVDAGAATRSAIQFVDPLNVTAVTKESGQRGKAQSDVQAQLAAQLAASGRPDLVGKDVKTVGQTEPQVAMALAAIQSKLQAANPASQMYDFPKLSAAEKQDPRLTAWQYAHVSLNKLSPTLYKQEEDKFKKTLGIR